MCRGRWHASIKINKSWASIRVCAAPICVVDLDTLPQRDPQVEQQTRCSPSFEDIHIWIRAEDVVCGFDDLMIV